MSLRNYLNGAHLVDFHDLHMKSDEVMDLLERFDMDVIYDFDRLREGTPDQYTAAAPDEGFQLRFDERHVVNTIWCHMRPCNRFKQIDPETVGVYIPESWSDAKRYAQTSNARVTDNPGAWLRIERDQLWVHYEFSGDASALSLITLMSPWK